jgi:hypothetical protein
MSLLPAYEGLSPSPELSEIFHQHNNSLLRIILSGDFAGVEVRVWLREPPLRCLAHPKGPRSFLLPNVSHSGRHCGQNSGPAYLRV